MAKHNVLFGFVNKDGSVIVTGGTFKDNPVEGFMFTKEKILEILNYKCSSVMEAYQAVTEDGFTTVESVEEFGNMFMEDGHIKKGLDAVYIYDQPTKKWGVSEFSHAGEYGVCEFSFGKM